MRARLIGLAAVLLGLSFAGAARAQDATGGFSDPFFLYYGFYLPRQSALAAQPQPEDFYRAQAVQRQAAVQNDRAGLYDPISTIGLEELDPLKPFGTRSGSTRMVATTSTGLRTTITGPSSVGAPIAHFGRVGTYYPSRRSPFGAARGGGARAGGGLPSAGPTLGLPTPIISPRSNR